MSSAKRTQTTSLAIERFRYPRSDGSTRASISALARSPHKRSVRVMVIGVGLFGKAVRYSIQLELETVQGLADACDRLGVEESAALARWSKIAWVH